MSHHAFERTLVLVVTWSWFIALLGMQMGLRLDLRVKSLPILTLPWWITLLDKSRAEGVFGRTCRWLDLVGGWTWPALCLDLSVVHFESIEVLLLDVGNDFLVLCQDVWLVGSSPREALVLDLCPQSSAKPTSRSE